LHASLEFLEVGHARRGKVLIGDEAAGLHPTLPSYFGFIFSAPLDLSVNCREVDRYFVSDVQGQHPDSGVRRLSPDAVLKLDDEVMQVRGVWDLLLEGDGRLFVNSLL
jgi:hypothetical protein